MAISGHDLSVYDAREIPSAEKLRIGIVVADYNSSFTTLLLEGCRSTLAVHGALPERVREIHVPGTYELTAGAMLLLESGKYDAVICLGCVVKGETRHDQYINQAVAGGLTSLTIQYRVPVVF